MDILRCLMHFGARYLTDKTWCLEESRVGSCLGIERILLCTWTKNGYNRSINPSISSISRRLQLTMKFFSLFLFSTTCNNLRIRYWEFFEALFGLCYKYICYVIWTRVTHVKSNKPMFIGNLALIMLSLIPRHIFVLYLFRINTVT